MQPTLVLWLVLALCILCAILGFHDTVLFKPLQEPGPVSFTFTQSPSLDLVSASVVNQTAYSDPIDVFIRPFHKISCFELAPRIFASHCFSLSNNLTASSQFLTFWRIQTMFFYKFISHFAMSIVKLKHLSLWKRLS